MTETLYDIYLTGKLLENTDAGTAQQHLAVLFKLSDDATAKLFDGKPHIIKRAATKTDALKYKTALHKIGVLTAFRAAADSNRGADSSTASEGTQHPLSRARPAIVQADTGANQRMTIAPAGTDILTPSERQPTVVADINTSGITLASVFDEPPVAAHDTPPAPDTSHINLAEVGADLGEGTHVNFVELPIDLSHMSIAEPGADLEELKEEKELLNPDTSAISLAPAGSNLVDPVEKNTPPAPNTDHMSLESGG